MSDNEQGDTILHRWFGLIMLTALAGGFISLYLDFPWISISLGLGMGVLIYALDNSKYRSRDTASEQSGGDRP